MEIKDKLTARQVAMQMATDIMCKISNYSSEYHLELAEKFYNWIVGNAELPEVCDFSTYTDKLIEVFTKTQNSFKSNICWLPIIHINEEATPLMIETIRKDIPVFLRSKDSEIKVVGSIEEYNKIVESGTISNYIEYSPVFNHNSEDPLKIDN